MGYSKSHLGQKQLGVLPLDLALSSKVAIGAFILSWGGMSVHAQIVSLLSHTNMRYLPFLIARLLHAFLSAAIVLLIWEPMQQFRSPQAVFLPHYEATSPYNELSKAYFPDKCEWSLLVLLLSSWVSSSHIPYLNWCMKRLVEQDNMGNYDHDYKGREHSDMIAAVPHEAKDLPPAIERLNELAFNLWFSWNHDALQLFESIDPVKWNSSRS